MTELDEELLPVAGELIDEYGADVQYGLVTPGDYDTATAIVAPVGGLAPHKALIGSGRVRTRSGGLVEGAELSLIVAGAKLAVDPTPEDKAEVNGTKYVTLYAEATYSGQAVAIWTIWLGK